VRAVRRRLFRGSGDYWDRRYRRGGTSGPGSYGDQARFKAAFLNQFAATHGIETVVEFGCGDGNQLSLARYPNYLGLDVSERAIALCRGLFDGDHTKRFELYDPESFSPGILGDLVLSLDVILHLVEDEIFDQHLQHLFAAAGRSVIIYGADVDQGRSSSAAHVRWRRFTSVIADRFPYWELAEVTPGLEPAAGADDPRSDFFVYRPT
jgi:hypothetical protein